MRSSTAIAVSCSALFLAAPASAQTVEDLQRQILELKAQVEALRAERNAELTTARSGAAVAPTAPQTAVASVPATQAPATPAPTNQAPAAQSSSPQLATADPSREKPKNGDHWYDRLKLRGYTQMRYNAFIDGDDTAPSGRSRLRSVHDSSINQNGGFSLRRARLILQGDLSHHVSLYFQSDFASAVNAQSNGERREYYVQLRDAYADVFLTGDHALKVRLGQSKVPFGWENLQSSSNRLTLDRSDAINSAVPSERDLGVVLFYTPTRVQRIWDRLVKAKQKTFGNYGAFALAAYNGQGVNRTEQNKGLATYAMATWPFELDGLGGAFRGQVLEVGGTAMLNKIRPELRTGGVSDADFTDNHFGVHAILYPQPFGLQAEWTKGRGPQYNDALRAIRVTDANGGYVQAMYDVGDIGLGRLMPYGRWQHYRGGWKASTNSPRLETDEIEVGVEWQIFDALELTLAYANMKRREADERRSGRAEGNLIRTQVQWNY